MTIILQKNYKRLRAIAKAVPLTLLNSKKIQSVITRMKSALAAERDGVAIAAPQIGEPWRIFIVSGKVLNVLKGMKTDAETNELPANNELAELIFINPVIKKKSRSKEWMEEGCLSVRYFFGKVRRSQKVTIRAYDERGRAFERGGAGLLAQIFQHEIDHLSGKLFIDNAREIMELPPDEAVKSRKTVA